MNSSHPSRLAVVIALILAGAVHAHVAAAATDPRSQAKAGKLLEAGQRDFERERYTKARTRLEQAYELAAAAGDAQLREETSFALARLDEQQGRTTDAERRYTEVATLAAARGDVDRQRAVLSHLGVLQSGRGDYTAAAATLAASIPLQE